MDLGLPPPPQTGVVDICLIPEIGFSLDKLCAHVAKVWGCGGMGVEGCGRGGRQGQALSAKYGWPGGGRKLLPSESKR